jgi:hypothetical protein
VTATENSKMGGYSPRSYTDIWLERQVLRTYEGNCRRRQDSFFPPEFVRGGGKFVPELTFKPFRAICADPPRAKFPELVARGLYL